MCKVMCLKYLHWHDLKILSSLPLIMQNMQLWIELSHLPQWKYHPNRRSMFELYLPLCGMQQGSVSMLLMPKWVLLIKWRLFEGLSWRYKTSQWNMLMFKWTFLGWFMCLCLSIRICQSWNWMQKMLIAMCWVHRDHKFLHWLFGYFHFEQKNRKVWAEFNMQLRPIRSIKWKMPKILSFWTLS